MLSDGIFARRGRYGSYLFRDRVNHRLRARRGARLAAITNGGAIPENALYTVVAMPEDTVVGRLLNLPVLLLPSFNSVGAEVGKPIAPQTASVGIATSKLVRSEGQVIRHNMGWTLITLGYLIFLSIVFYYLFPNLMSL